MSSKTSLISLAVGLLFGAAFGFFASRVKIKPVERIIRDTCVISRIDTISVEKWREKRIYIKDSIRVPVLTPVYYHDTTFVALPREVIECSDDSTFRAVISGYEPHLDAIEVYSKTNTITITERVKPSRWSVGVSAGYSINKAGLSPYIGVGLQYSLIQF